MWFSGPGGGVGGVWLIRYCTLASQKGGAEDIYPEFESRLHLDHCDFFVKLNSVYDRVGGEGYKDT